MPGPGEYNILKEFGSDKRKVTLKPRLKFYYETSKSSAPSPDKYNPKTKLTESTRFHNITFGYG